LQAFAKPCKVRSISWRNSCGTISLQRTDIVWLMGLL